MMTQEERTKAAAEARSQKLDLMLSMGIKDIKVMGEAMFDLGRAYGLSEAAEMLKEPG